MYLPGNRRIICSGSVLPFRRFPTSDINAFNCRQSTPFKSTMAFSQNPNYDMPSPLLSPMWATDGHISPSIRPATGLSPNNHNASATKKPTEIPRTNIIEELYGTLKKPRTFKQWEDAARETTKQIKEFGSPSPLVWVWLLFFRGLPR